MANKEYQEYTISVNAAARKYGIPQSTLARWAAQGRIKVLAQPGKRGQKMLVDEASVIHAAQHGRSYWRRVRTIHEPADPPPPFRFCPYCGRPLNDQEKPNTI